MSAQSQSLTSHSRNIKDNQNEPFDEFPSTLEGFGYKFNTQGKFLNIETNKPFVFAVSNNDDYNQKHYEALGEVITNYIYELLETKTHLQKLTIPIDPLEKEASTFIFVSEDAMTNPNKLLILVHGSGVVRAGQWARRLIINDCLDSGTQIPFIKRALNTGYGVIVLNTNDNYVVREGKQVPIRGSETPEKHINYVWENVIPKAKAKKIAIIAHSYGGVCLMDLIKHHEKELQERVFAVALTDSVHSLQLQNVSLSAVKWLQKIARNWVSNQKPLDESVFFTDRNEVPRVSAGTTQHAMTSWSSFESIFRFLGERDQSPPIRNELYMKQLLQASMRGSWMGPKSRDMSESEEPTITTTGNDFTPLPAYDGGNCSNSVTAIAHRR